MASGRNPCVLACRQAFYPRGQPVTAGPERWVLVVTICMLSVSLSSTVYSGGTRNMAMLRSDRYHCGRRVIVLDLGEPWTSSSNGSLHVVYPAQQPTGACYLAPELFEPRVNECPTSHTMRRLRECLSFSAVRAYSSQVNGRHDAMTWPDTSPHGIRHQTCSRVRSARKSRVSGNIIKREVR